MKKGESRYVKQNLRRSESRKIGKRKRTWNGKLGSRIHVRTEKGKTRDNMCFCCRPDPDCLYENITYFIQENPVFFIYPVWTDKMKSSRNIFCKK